MPFVPKFIQDLFLKSDLRTNCSGLFKEVAKGLPGFSVPNLTANELIEEITNEKQWKKIGQGEKFGPQAALHASEGYLVVAVLRAADHKQAKLNPKTHNYDIPYTYEHGHIAIVLSEAVKGYPYVISGSKVPIAQSGGSKIVTVDVVWRKVDAPNVTYYRTLNTYQELMKPKVP
ncbi:MAG TPA: hypothetical protein PLN21_03580 [Gemmatales bacterium]|nr:hypothetical protein [Gemmatales bacterium]